MSAELQSELRRLESAFPHELSGWKAAAALSDAVDDAIRRIWDSVGGPTTGCALIAIGGYGRRHMCPQSDIDLLILTGKKVAVDEAVRGLSYALWDAGFQLGFNTAGEKEAHRLAGEDFDSKCAHLDARLVSGDPGLYEEFRGKSLAGIRRSSRDFLEKLREISTARWQKEGDAGAELEPDLKRSKGGLRDIASLNWVALATEQTAGPVTGARLDKALDVLLAIRQALHYEVRRPTDLLSMQVQIPVAKTLGIDEYELMRQLYESCRPISLAAETVLIGADALQPLSDRFTGVFGPSSSDSWMGPAEGSVPADRPQAGAAAKTEEARSGDARSPSGMRGERQGLAQWPEPAKVSFLEILRSGPSGRRAFRAIDVSGALTAALPAWQGIHNRAQRNIYHRWAVDVHSYETVCELVNLRKDPDDLVGRVAKDSEEHWDSLLVAGLLHDIGKGRDQDHSLIGETLADECTAAMGMLASAARDVAWLVRNHLLLVQVATLRDISEEALIVDLAETVGSERRLRMLYLLSIADARATGPAAWTDWKAGLVTQLFSEVNHLLERKELVGGDASRRAASRAAELKEKLSDAGGRPLEEHLAQMPRAWLLSQEPDALLRQSRMMLNRPDGPLQLEATRAPEANVWEVTVVAPDRPGLFSKVSGVLALHGLGVVSAQAFTREDGVALEVFRVEAPAGRHERFSKVTQDAARAISGELSLTDALKRKRKDYAGRTPKGKQHAPEVLVDNRASDFYTVIEVHATDRIGLLYEITSVLADFGLDIHLAKVATYAEDVVDSFYVRDLEGQKLTDPSRQAALESEVLSRVLSAAPDSI